jgi:hypothetical protein
LSSWGYSEIHADQMLLVLSFECAKFQNFDAKSAFHEVQESWIGSY